MTSSRAARAPRWARSSSCSAWPRAAPSRGTLEPLAARSATHRRASAARGTPRSGRRCLRARCRATRLRPLVRHAGERDRAARARRAPLRVVRLRRQQVEREALRALEFARVELVDGRSRSGRGRRRPRSARRAGSSGRTRCPRRPSPSRARSSAGSGRRTRRAPRLARAAGSARGRRAARARDLARSSSSTRAALRLDVRAVDVERRERERAGSGTSGEPRAAARNSGSNVVRATSSFASCAISANERDSPVSSAYSSVSGSSAARVDEEAR